MRVPNSLGGCTTPGRLRFELHSQPMLTKRLDSLQYFAVETEIAQLGSQMGKPSGLKRSFDGEQH